MVYGVLKSEARRLFRRRTSHDLAVKRSKCDAVREMIDAWDRLSGETLEAAWTLYQNEEEWKWGEDP
jgi:hypothetical protein